MIQDYKAEQRDYRVRLSLCDGHHQQMISPQHIKSACVPKPLAKLHITFHTNEALAGKSSLRVGKLS